jgi:hypothetical protein
MEKIISSFNITPDGFVDAQYQMRMPIFLSLLMICKLRHKQSLLAATLLNCSSRYGRQDLKRMIRQGGS